MNPIHFLRQVRAEVKKVSWPNRRETVASTIAVFVMVLISMIFLFFADQVLAFAVRFILGLNS